MHSPLLRLRFSQMSGRLRPRYASNSAPITNKSQILEKPTRFNPPSHGARRVQRKIYPGPRLSEAEAIQQKTRKYPNMMPPEGSFMHNFLTDRRLHVWISLVHFLADTSRLDRVLTDHSRHLLFSQCIHSPCPSSILPSIAPSFPPRLTLCHILSPRSASSSQYTSYM
jgi:hypothetical protein